MKFIAVLALAVGLTCAHEVLPQEIHQYYCMQWRPVQEPYDITTQEHYDISEKITNQTTLIDIIHDTLDRQTDLMVKVLAEINKASDINSINEKLNNQTSLLDKQSYLLDEILEEIGNLPNSTKESDKSIVGKHSGNPTTLISAVQNMLMEWNNDLKTQNNQCNKYVTCKLESQRCQMENQHFLDEINWINSTLNEVKEFKNDMKLENTRLLVELQGQKNKTCHLKKSVARQKDEIDILQNETTELKESNDHWKNENQKLVAELQMQQNETMSLNKSMEEVKEFKNDMKLDNTRLLVELQGQKNKTCHLKKSVARQKDEIDILQNETTELKESNDHWKNENQKLVAELQMQQNKTMSLNKSMEDVTRLKTTLEQTNQRQMDQIMFLQNQTAEVIESKKRLESIIEKQMDQIQTLQNQSTEVIESKKRLESIIEKQMDQIQTLQNQSTDVRESRDSIQNEMNKILEELQQLRNESMSADCAEIYKQNKRSGVHKIMVGGCPNGKKMQVRCDMNHGGGWTVIQRRFDGSVNFQKNWDAYKNGFGTPDREYWLGNDNIHLLSSSKTYQLLVELTAHDGTKATAKYENFTVAGESDNYRMTHGAFIGGTAGDSLIHQNGMQFSTYDKDNDKYSGSCSDKYGGRGGWWYKSCDRANVNGGVYHTSPVDDDDSIDWYAWRGRQSLKGTIMAIRPKNF